MRNKIFSYAIFLALYLLTLYFLFFNTFLFYLSILFTYIYTFFAFCDVEKQRLFFIFYFLFFIFYFLFFIFYFLFFIFYFDLGIGIYIYHLALTPSVVVFLTDIKFIKSNIFLLLLIFQCFFNWLGYMPDEFIPIVMWAEHEDLKVGVLSLSILLILHIVWLIYRKEWQLLIPFYNFFKKTKNDN